MQTDACVLMSLEKRSNVLKIKLNLQTLKKIRLACAWHYLYKLCLKQIHLSLYLENIYLKILRAQAFSCKLWDIFKNNFFTEHLWTTTRVKLGAGSQPPSAAKCRKWEIWNPFKTRKKNYENIFLLILRQDHFSNSRFSISKPVIFSLKLRKNNPIRHLWWLVLETQKHRLSENMFLLSLREDHFSN